MGRPCWTGWPPGPPGPSGPPGPGRQPAPPVPPSTGTAAGAGTEASSRPAATAALALMTALSAAGLLRVFTGHRWIGPVLGTIAATHALCWVLRRGRVGHAAAAVAALAGIVLMECWTVLGRFTTYGIPTGRTWDHATSALGDLHNEIASLVAPVVPTTAFELLAVAGAGLAAGAADALAFRVRNPLAAVIPAMAVFVFCCTSGGGRGRAVTIALEATGILWFLLVERATAAGS